MKKIVFGGFQMLTGMLLFLVLRAYELTPGQHDFGMVLLVFPYAFVLLGFVFGILGLKERDR